MLWLTIRQLKSRQVAKRRQAAEALRESPTSASYRALLTAATTDPDHEVRCIAANAIARIEDDCRIPGLLAILRDRHPEVQKAAMAGLKNAMDEGVVPALIPLLRSPDPGVRGYAATLLHRRNWKPVEREDDIFFCIARGELARAAQHGAAAIPALEGVVQTGAYNQRVAAVEALGRIDDKRVVKPLLAALQSNDPTVCAAAVAALGQIGDGQAFDPVVGMLRHPDGHVRAVAVDTLGRVAAGRGLEALQAMLSDPVWDVRRAAAGALGRAKDARAVDALNQTLRDEDADVREAAALALGSMRDRRAIAPLVKALTDPTSGVRRIAAAALSRIDENWSGSLEAQGAVDELQASLQSKDSEARFRVSSLLNNLGVRSPEAEVLLPNQTPSSTTETRRKLAASLFLNLLGDTDRLLRLAAAESLGQLGEPRAQTGLRRALQDPDAGVRLAAERSLAALEQTEAVA